MYVLKMAMPYCRLGSSTQLVFYRVGVWERLLAIFMPPVGQGSLSFGNPQHLTVCL